MSFYKHRRYRKAYLRAVVHLGSSHQRAVVVVVAVERHTGMQGLKLTSVRELRATESSLGAQTPSERVILVLLIIDPCQMRYRYRLD